MNPLWLFLIVPASLVAGAACLIALAWVTRDIFSVLIELNPEYAALARQRIGDEAPLLAAS